MNQSQYVKLLNLLTKADALLFKPNNIEYYILRTYEQKKSKGFPREPTLQEYILNLALLSGMNNSTEDAFKMYRVFGCLLRASAECMAQGDVECKKLWEMVKERAEKAENKEALDKLIPILDKAIEAVSSKKSDRELGKIVKELEALLKQLEQK